MNKILFFSFLALSSQLSAKNTGVQSATPVAGGIVRSKEWKIKRTPFKEEEFIGDVSYHGPQGVIRTDWALFRHEAQTWQAHGQVNIERKIDSGDIIFADGDTASYDQKTQRGWLLPKAGTALAFKRLAADGTPPDFASGARLDWIGRAKTHLSGSVHIWGPRLEAWSTDADFIDPPRQLKLTGGRPVVHKISEQADWTMAVKADQITAWETSLPIKVRHVAAEGKASGWIRFKDHEHTKKAAL